MKHRFGSIKLDAVDVTLVTTRRPDLLEKTLQSFSQHLFSYMSVRRLFVNIDALWGDGQDDKAVESICRSYFNDVIIRRPITPSFGDAVKWLWAQPRSKWFLHLEDDWLLLRPIDCGRLISEMRAEGVAQVSLSRLNRKAWRKGVWLNRFTTSPSFVKASFARQISMLQNPNLDPEKQLYDGRNPEVTEFVKGFRHRLHGSRFTRTLIMDIGREWRDQRHIDKKVIEGRSIWMDVN